MYPNSLFLAGMNCLIGKQLLPLDFILHTLRNVRNDVGKECCYYKDEVLGEKEGRGED